MSQNQRHTQHPNIWKIIGQQRSTAAIKDLGALIQGQELPAEKPTSAIADSSKACCSSQNILSILISLLAPPPKLLAREEQLQGQGDATCFPQGSTAANKETWRYMPDIQQANLLFCRKWWNFNKNVIFVILLIEISTAFATFPILTNQ